MLLTWLNTHWKKIFKHLLLKSKRKLNCLEDSDEVNQSSKQISWKLLTDSPVRFKSLEMQLQRTTWVRSLSLKRFLRYLKRLKPSCSKCRNSQQLNCLSKSQKYCLQRCRVFHRLLECSWLDWLLTLDLIKFKVFKISSIHHKTS